MRVRVVIAAKLTTAAMLALVAAVAIAAEGTTAPAVAPGNPAPVDATAAPRSEGAPPKLEPKALAILKAACDKLAAAKTMSFNALIEEEGPDLRYGLPLQFSRIAHVALRRPDELFVKGHGSGPDTQFFYDGRTLIAWMPQQNLVATAPAPATVDAMLKDVYAKAAIYFPFEDLIVADPYKDLMDGLEVASYIGQSDVVAGVETDMITFGNDAAFVQAWIGTEDKLPHRLRAVYLDDPAALRHDMVLSDWTLDAPLPPSTFIAKVPANAGKIPFQHPADMAPMAAPPKTGAAEASPDSRESQAPAKENRQ
jgi:hypothetical protein